MAFTQNDDNQEQNQQNGALTTGGGQGSAVGNTPGAGPVSTANPNKQGSGRFTNLSKYVQANKQGSENLANRIGSGIQNQLTANEKDVSGKATKLDSGIQAGDATLKTAGAEEQRLKSIGDQFKANQNFNILDANSRGQFGTAQNQVKDFVSNNPNYNVFKTAQAGNAVDEQALGSQLNDTRQTANQYQNLFKNRQAQVGSTQGREQALQEFVGGANQAVRPTYTSGQRKLDQLVLGQNSQNLQGLINKVGANKSNVDQALNTVGNLDTGFNTLKTNEQNLIGAIGNTSKAAQSGFQSAFGQDKIDQVNQARDAAYNKDKEQLQSGNMSADLINRVGLTDKYNEMQSYYDAALAADPYAALYDPTFGGLYTGGFTDKLRENQGDLDTILQRQKLASTTDDITTSGDIDTDNLLAQITGGGQKFNKVGDLSTNTTIDSAKFLSGIANSTKNKQDELNRQLLNQQQMQELQDFLKRNQIRRV